MVELFDRQSPVEHLERSLGEQLRAERVRQRLDQEELAKAAGVTRAVVSRLENGTGATVHSLLAVIRALGRTGWIETFKPAVTVRPLEVLRSAAPPQRRVRKRKDEVS
jgi:transcriptional regulator with XRE-family HTH domain